MFGLFKQHKAEKEAANRIGVELHRQLKEALTGGGKEAEQRVASFFVVGYLHGFVTIGFSTQGISGEQAADKYLRYICDGVMPNKLYEIFERLLSALELAKSLGKNEEIEQFELGFEVGVFDAGALNYSTNLQANNLTTYLIGKEVEYSSVKL